MRISRGGLVIGFFGVFPTRFPCPLFGIYQLLGQKTGYIIVVNNRLHLILLFYSEVRVFKPLLLFQTVLVRDHSPRVRTDLPLI